jgi:S-adenosylmethionine decarboxylase
MTNYKTYGQHVVTDAWGIDFDKINNIDFLKEHMEKAAETIGANVLLVKGWKFEPYGASVVVVLSESHISIHTYPERGYAAMDGYTCGEKMDPEIAIRYLIGVLQPKEVHSQKIIRGTGKLIMKERK